MLCVGLSASGVQARVMQSMGQALEVEVLDKDEGSTDDKLGRWVRRAPPARAGAAPRFAHATPYSRLNQGQR